MFHDIENEALELNMSFSLFFLTLHISLLRFVSLFFTQPFSLVLTLCSRYFFPLCRPIFLSSRTFNYPHKSLIQGHVRKDPTFASNHSPSLSSSRSFERARAFSECDEPSTRPGNECYQCHKQWISISLTYVLYIVNHSLNRIELAFALLQLLLQIFFEFLF